MTPPKEIIRLVERFDQNRDQYLSGDYNEAQLRQEFINPFFAALGWDIENRLGYAEPYKEVIHEDAIKIGSATKAPDYAFRIGGVRKFFVEAKNPSINLKEDATPAYQLRRYAWSAKLPLSILTDFEEFVIYDCHTKPLHTDKASAARVQYFTYKDYALQWESIASVFSKESVLKGSFDKYADSARGKKGTAEVDDAFLKEIESWREVLAKNIAVRNPKLSQPELNFAVQRTIDRIIFLRICEDRGIEPYGRLQMLVNGERVYRRLYEQFYRADEKYNSGLFHFDAEKGRPEQPDELTPNLHIDDKPLKEIIGNLYYPDCPYEFSVLPADILGQVYEQFLGKVIRLTAGHQAKVEEKPEVKKAGGVYYTPTYIVDYIVKNTVGKLLNPEPSEADPQKANVILSPVGGDLVLNDETKDLIETRTDREGVRKPKSSKSLTPKEASKLRILDPACGSGSFLIGAYQYLLNWHHDWYVKDGPEKHTTGKTAELFRGPGGGWRLTTAERKRILLNNIYGVDIDSQAVEVTKLSLLLKVLEGENEQTISQQLKMFHERALPDLASNIKCGNSLIGPDFYEGKQLSLLDDEEKNRINVFDWKSEFKEIMDAGGFDAVIGNPPYIRIQMMKEWAPVEVEFYKEAYQSARAGNYDIYVVFVERALTLLNSRGKVGFILPHKFFNAQYGEGLRSLIAKGKHLAQIVHFGDKQVFENALTYTCLLFLDRKPCPVFVFEQVNEISEWQNVLKQAHRRIDTIPAAQVSQETWSFVVGSAAEFWDRIGATSTKLRDVAERIFQGLITGADTVFILKKTEGSFFYSESLSGQFILEISLLHPLCKGSVNIRRYRISEIEKYILFPYSVKNGKAELISENEMRRNYPNTWKYLSLNKELLQDREHGKWKHDRWYAFGRSQNLCEMEQKKILTPSIASQASFTLDIQDHYFVGSGGGGGGGYGLTLKKNEKMSYHYVLGLLNSKLLDTYLKSHSSRFSGGYYAYNRQYIEQLPFRSIDFSNPADKSRHDKMVQLVEQMLSLHKQLPAAKTEQEKTVIQRQIDATDRQIDALVYELYGLTEEEIRIVEG